MDMDSMPIYEPHGLKSAWQLENEIGWAFVIETDAGQFRLGTDRPYRSESLGALLLTHMDVPFVREVEGIQDVREGWEAWVFDRQICAMCLRELELASRTRRERDIGEEMPIPTIEEANEIYRRRRIPRAMRDVKSVFRDCVEVGDDGRPLTSRSKPIEDFWREGRFIICDEWRRWPDFIHRN